MYDILGKRFPKCSKQIIIFKLVSNFKSYADPFKLIRRTPVIINTIFTASFGIVKSGSTSTCLWGQFFFRWRGHALLRFLPMNKGRKKNDSRHNKNVSSAWKRIAFDVLTSWLAIIILETMRHSSARGRMPLKIVTCISTLGVLL